MNRADILFVGIVLIDFSLSLIVVACLRHRILKPAVYCLLIYAAISIYTDCMVAIIKLDRLLGWGGAARQRVVSIANITFALDAVSRVAVFIGICLCILTLKGMTERARSIDSQAKHVG